MTGGTLRDPGFNATVAFVERHRIGPAQAFLAQRTRREAEQQRPKMLGIAADQSARESNDFAATRGQGSCGVALSRVCPFLFVNLVQDQIFEEVFQRSEE